jgi:hypothetical protein
MMYRLKVYALLSISPITQFLYELVSGVAKVMINARHKMSACRGIRTWEVTEQVEKTLALLQSIGRRGLFRRK